MTTSTILALEFSSARRSVALADGRGQLLAEAASQTSLRGTDAFGLIEQALAQAKVGREEIGVLAIGLGPGSYTGIRAAIAVAQGWQLARPIQLLGISSADSLAAQAQKEGIFGKVNVVIDAQRGEFYSAQWDITNLERREILPLKIVAAAAITAGEAEGQICVGPDRARALYPTAAMVAALAASREDFVAGEALEPIYLRETAFVKARVAEP